jgi:hypothetical protein
MGLKSVVEGCWWPDRWMAGVFIPLRSVSLAVVTDFALGLVPCEDSSHAALRAELLTKTM